MEEIAQNIPTLIAFASAVLLLTTIHALNHIYTNLRLKHIAHKLGIEFRRRTFRPYANITWYEAFGSWQGYPVLIKEYPRRKVRLISVSLSARNPTRGKVSIRFRSLWEKRRNYFGNKWDDYFIVASTPVAFGKQVFADEKIIGIFIQAYPILSRIREQVIPIGVAISITKAGKIEIRLKETFLTQKRAEKLLDSARQIAQAMENFTPQKKEGGATNRETIRQFPETA